MSTEWIRSQVERLLRNAEEALGKRDWTSVADLARDILALDPDSDDGRGLLAAAHRALGNAEVASSTHVAAADSSVAEHPEHPAAFANGRYEVQKFLGEGGKKRVYLAHDTVLDRAVALAVIKTEGLDDTSRARITREARAMGRLGDHPHILPIHDLGEESGQPYMVQPFMAGGDIEGLLSRAEDHRLGVGQAIDLAMQVCQGLKYAHSHGIVHRDLKPGNVYLADGVAKIGDFGLAVVIDRSRLTQEGMMVGTVSYMPPEQAMGSEVTARADLYAVGAMLYEMVCGRPPFLGDDSVAIIGQHINTPPVAPTWHRQECPRSLEALILRLLAKDPSERPASASDVLTALEGIDLSVTEQPAPEHDEAHALDSLAGGVFVGRQREMGELKAALEDALSGRGRLVTLVGEPGIGKTRTAQELATYAGLRGCQVLWGRCHESRGAPPYWPWMQAIRSYVRERDADQVRSEMGTGAADIAEIVSDVRERIPDLKPSSALDDPEQARFRLFDAITAFLKTASRGLPLVIILDNLHWADKPSLLLLEFLAQEFADSRLMVIGTYRDVDLSRQHPLAETLGELTRERLFQRVLLRGLSQEDVGRFIEITSGVMPPRGLVEAVHTQTEGNPLFVTEVVRLLVQEGELTQERARQRESWEVRIPEGVREVIGRRLNRLSARCNETLTIASVIGREFELRQLVRLVVDMSEDWLLEVLEEALSARVIEELQDAVGRWQFTHALIQQTFYDELTTTRRVRLHARIVEVLEELYGQDVETHAVQLALHAAEAEATVGSEKLVKYSILAGKRALDGNAYEGALSYFERALRAKESRPMDAETAEIMFGMGRSQAAMSQPAEARDSLSRAFDYWAAVGDATRAVAVAESLPPGAGLLGMAQLTARALELVPPDSIREGRLLSRHGLDLGRTEGDYEGAQDALMRALAIAEREKDAALEMRTLVSAADVDGNYLHLHECLEKSLRAIELAHEADDRYAEALARFWASTALIALGDSGGAALHADAGVETAERLRDRYRLANAIMTKTMLALSQGNWTEAREFSDRALSLVPQHPMQLGQRIVLECQVGDFDQGRIYLERLVEVLRSEDTEYWRPDPHMIVLAARISRMTDYLDVAKAAATRMTSSAKNTPRAVVLASMALAITAVEEGDATAAGQQYTVLEPLRGTLLYGAGRCTDSLLGLLAHTMGKLDDSSTHFEDSLAFCRRTGNRPELAWTCCDYADILKERGGPGDQEKATALLEESLAISRELGMRPLMERVLSRREILGA